MKVEIGLQLQINFTCQNFSLVTDRMSDTRVSSFGSAMGLKQVDQGFS